MQTIARLVKNTGRLAQSAQVEFHRRVSLKLENSTMQLCDGSTNNIASKTRNLSKKKNAAQS